MLTLLGLLERRVLVGGPELARELGIDARELRTEIERLDSLDLGTRLERKRGRRGGYSLARGDAFPPLILSGEEALAVVVALRRLRREADPQRLGAAERRHGRTGSRETKSIALASSERIAGELQNSAGLVLNRIERLLPAQALQRRGLAERSLATVAAEIAAQRRLAESDA